MRLSVLFAAAFAASLVSHSAGPVNAAGPARLPSYVAQSRAVLAPMGYVVFCMRMPKQCHLSGRRGIFAGIAGRPLDVTPIRMQRMREINSRVNRTIVPRADHQADAIGDQWRISPRAGDCEDYALTKRVELMRAGFPASVLRLATARTYSGVGHAVLVVRTSEGDFVLDNRSDQILTWDKADLAWVSIQSSADPRRWYAIDAAPSAKPVS